MDWKQAILGGKRYFSRNNTDSDFLPKYYQDILKTVESNRKFIHSQRKQLDFSVIGQNALRVVDNNISTDSCFVALRRTQEEFFNLQKEFQRTVDEGIRKSMKLLDEECEHLIKLNSDLMKIYIDLQKAQKKLQDCDLTQKDSLTHSCNNLDGVFWIHLDHVKHELFKYSLKETDRSKIIAAHLQSQIKFLNDCVSKAVELCPSNSINSDLNCSSFFGTDITGHVTEPGGFSKVISTCLFYLTVNNLYKHEGIFRLAGQISRIHLLRDGFDKNMVTDELLEFCGCDVVADVLKQYLRELPNSLLTDSFISQWVSAKDSMTPETAYKIIMDLPAPNQSNFIAVMRFIGLVVDFQEESKMNSANIGTVFYMNFYRRSLDQTLNSIQVVAPIVQYLADNFSLIFKDDNESGVIKYASLSPNPDSKMTNPMDPLSPGVRSKSVESFSNLVTNVNAHVANQLPSAIPNVPTRTYVNRNSTVEPLKPQLSQKRNSEIPRRPAVRGAAPPPPSHHPPPPQLPFISDSGEEKVQDSKAPSMPLPVPSKTESSSVLVEDESLSDVARKPSSPEPDSPQKLVITDGEVVFSGSSANQVEVTASSSDSSDGAEEEEASASVPNTVLCNTKKEATVSVPNLVSRKTVKKATTTNDNKPTTSFSLPHESTEF